MANSEIFNISFQTFIEDTIDTSISQLFVYRYDCDKSDIGQRENVIKDDSIGSVISIDRYLEIGKYVFIHGLNYSDEDMAGIKKNTAKRVVWCVWGHDLYSFFGHRNIIYNFLWDLYHDIKSKFLKSKAFGKKKLFRAYVAGFSGDRYYIEKKYHARGKVYDAVYPMGYYLSDIKKWETVRERNDYKIRVMVGHSAFPFINHKSVIDRLACMKERMQVYIPLSYGVMDYATEIKEYAYRALGAENVVILDKMLTPQEYFCILQEIDAAVFDFDNQSAYGNMLVLLYLNKPLFLSKNGVMYKGFKRDGLDVWTIEDIFKYDSIVKRMTNTINREYAASILAYEKIQAKWRKLYNDLLDEGLF